MIKNETATFVIFDACFLTWLHVIDQTHSLMDTLSLLYAEQCVVHNGQYGKGRYYKTEHSCACIEDHIKDEDSITILLNEKIDLSKIYPIRKDPHDITIFTFAYINRPNCCILTVDGNLACLCVKYDIPFGCLKNAICRAVFEASEPLNEKIAFMCSGDNPFVHYSATKNCEKLCGTVCIYPYDN